MDTRKPTHERSVGNALVLANGAHDGASTRAHNYWLLLRYVTEAITLNCARTGVPLEGLDVIANVDVDPGPITGAKNPSDWNTTLKTIQVNVTARGKLSKQDREMVEEGATRSPVHHIFSSGKQVKTTFRYES